MEGDLNLAHLLSTPISVKILKIEHSTPKDFHSSFRIAKEWKISTKAALISLASSIASYTSRMGPSSNRRTQFDMLTLAGTKPLKPPLKIAGPQGLEDSSQKL